MRLFPCALALALTAVPAAAQADCDARAATQLSAMAIVEHRQWITEAKPSDADIAAAQNEVERLRKETHTKFEAGDTEAPCDFYRQITRFYREQPR